MRTLTERLVKAVSGRIMTAVADVRNRPEIQAAYDAGMREFGHVDIVLPNAGIMPLFGPGEQEQAWHDGISTMLTGVRQTMEVALPAMIARGQGGSIIITSSSAGLSSIGLNTCPGQAAYSAAKHGVVGLMRLYASQLAKHSIRVVTVHPTGVNTPMVVNAPYAEFMQANPEAYYSRSFPVCDRAAAQRFSRFGHGGYMLSPPSGRRWSGGEDGQAGGVVMPAGAGLVPPAPY
jgi:NAD(P)-dependent dehydrogenase (short-subunit alcohol dehydrogenase family)